MARAREGLREERTSLHPLVDSSPRVRIYGAGLGEAWQDAGSVAAIFRGLGRLVGLGSHEVGAEEGVVAGNDVG